LCGARNELEKIGKSTSHVGRAEPDKVVEVSMGIEKKIESEKEG
jgi:hypothetical protein